MNKETAVYGEVWETKFDCLQHLELFGNIYHVLLMRICVSGSMEDHYYCADILDSKCKYVQKYIHVTTC